MALVNVDTILNSNPTKRLRIAFDNLKQNYTIENAEAYKKMYEDAPLSFIIENSRYIFSEPMLGYSFYKEQVVENPYALMFENYEDEILKISAYITECGSKIPSKQKEMYDLLRSEMEEKYNDTYSTRMILRHANTDEYVQESYETLMDLVYGLTKEYNESKVDTIASIINTTKSPDLFFAVTPYIVALENSGNCDYLIMNNISKFITECEVTNKCIDIDEWKNFIESVVIMSKLYQDKTYTEAVSKTHKTTRMVLEAVANESLTDQLNELFIEHVTDTPKENAFNESSFDTYYSSPSRAVMQIFDDDNFYGIMSDENSMIKENRNLLYESAIDIIDRYVEFEYVFSDKHDDEIGGYNFFEDGTTLETAFNIFTEAKDEKISNGYGTPSDAVATTAGLKSTERKPYRPNASSLTTKIQNKAMDFDVRHNQVLSKVRKGYENVKGATKAVLNAPKDIVNELKHGVNEWDKWDDDRRREYIKKPGYRKKLFKRLRLALLYGVAGMTNLALIPVVFTVRHYSKIKDKRIRNDLARELDTEIKVCEEKIADAAANGDSKAKYKLMRIKSQLEKEAARVKSNSLLI